MLRRCFGATVTYLPVTPFFRFPCVVLCVCENEVLGLGFGSIGVRCAGVIVLRWVYIYRVKCRFSP